MSKKTKEQLDEYYDSMSREAEKFRVVAESLPDGSRRGRDLLAEASKMENEVFQYLKSKKQ
jgi:hypothetical protein